MNFLSSFIIILIFANAVAAFEDTYDGPLTCYNETLFGGQLDNPTKLAYGCYSCWVCCLNEMY